MKLRTIAARCIVAVICAGGVWDLPSSSAQVASTPGAPPMVQPPPEEEPGQPQNDPFAATVTREAYPTGNVFYGGGGARFHVSANRGGRQSTEALHAAAAALRDAKDEAAKSDAQAKLTELLQKYFDDDLRRREEELAKIEERTRQLRELLEKRRTKKSEILDLQMKVLLNEADGLGFFNDAPSYGASALSIDGPQRFRAWTTYPEAGAAYGEAPATGPKPTPSR